MIWQSLAAAAGFALLLAGAGVGVLRLLRGRSIGVMFAVVAVITVVATLGGVLAVTLRMLLQGDSRDVVLTVVAVGGIVGFGVALVMARRVVLASRRLVGAVREVSADGGGFTPPEGLPAELATIAGALDEAYARLRAARERERALEFARRELVAWVSHDLRTPLAGMRAMAEALEDGVAADQETVARYHRQIGLEVDRLTAMVDDLFELSRIHAGALRLAPARLDLRDLVADALAAAEPPARSQGVRLAADPGPPIAVRADPNALGRALRNLVANGIRHTPPGGEVRIRAAAHGERARLSVTDACGGIPPGDLPRVFDIAFRGETARTPTPDGGGAGLGLAIARGLVEAHDGVITVANDGPGCRFDIEIPAGTR
ncbi:two-component sensor histidine kinase [Spongiactinospora rosea]|uniref:histidine kinase n=1 Tax=Spongiactinospora rosea TaxID=2248750 RepID=A0A366M4Y8_9ACTN|nr:HAMP domain-containing sensor histidine kinase [Spongiactinospora rosea]RBQ21255.1 two-component sensor histidine kinase [Spongiactinospora rosea]